MGFNNVSGCTTAYGVAFVYCKMETEVRNNKIALAEQINFLVLFGSTGVCVCALLLVVMYRVGAKRGESPIILHLQSFYISLLVVFVIVAHTHTLTHTQYFLECAVNSFEIVLFSPSGSLSILPSSLSLCVSLYRRHSFWAQFRIWFTSAGKYIDMNHFYASFAQPKRAASIYIFVFACRLHTFPHRRFTFSLFKWPTCSWNCVVLPCFFALLFCLLFAQLNIW